MVQHHINNHAGHRHIQPDRQSPARNSFMSGEIRSPGSIQGDHDHWHNDDREYYMGNQDREVKGPDKSLPQELRVTVIVVISKIRNQEESRSDDGGELALQVGPDSPFANHDEPDYQKHRTR